MEYSEQYQWRVSCAGMHGGPRHIFLRWDRSQAGQTLDDFVGSKHTSELCKPATIEHRFVGEWSEGRDDLEQTQWLVKTLQKNNTQLQQRLNRIDKLTPGHGRLNEFDRLAMELEVEIDLIRDGCAGEMSTLELERIDQIEKDVLFLRRIDWDLNRLRDTVRGNPRKSAQVNYETGKYDVGNWEGERP